MRPGAVMRGDLARLTPPNSLPINPACYCNEHPRGCVFRRGGVSRAAKGADCKSAGLRLRRFESYLPHQPEDRRLRTEIFGAAFVRSLSSVLCRLNAGVAQW